MVFWLYEKKFINLQAVMNRRIDRRVPGFEDYTLTTYTINTDIRYER